MTTPPGYVLIKSSELKESKVEVKDEVKKNEKMGTTVSIAQKPGKSVLGFALQASPKHYTLLFRNINNQVNGVGGTDFANITWNMSGLADFGSASALFQECRVIAARITFSPSLPAAGVVSRQIVGPCFSSTSNPTAESDVLQLQPLKMFTTGRTTPLSLTVKTPDYGWASCASPAPGPYAGLYGGFWYSSVGQASMSTVTYLSEVLIEFRGRT